jgi:hypothetical protein
MRYDPPKIPDRDPDWTTAVRDAEIEKAKEEYRKHNPPVKTPLWRYLIAPFLLPVLPLTIFVLVVIASMIWPYKGH